MISYSLIKKKISSNLKNFFDGNDNETSYRPSANDNEEEQQNIEENCQI